MERNRLNNFQQSRPIEHICVVSETYPPEVNGVTLTLGHLIKGLLARGRQVSVVRPRRDKSDGSGPDVALVNGLPLPGYKGLQFGLPAGGILHQTWTRRRPDAVYVATEGPLGWSAVSIARRLAIPVFSGFHTNFHAYSRHYRLGFLGNFVFGYLRHFHNRTSGTFVPSPDLRDRLNGLGFHNVGCVGRGVDSQLFNPARRSQTLRREWGLTEKDLAIVHVGRVAGEKNLGLAFDAYRTIKKTLPSARFIAVGDGPLRQTLEAGNRDIIFAGMQRGERLAMHYASGDLFLFPSETETFGNVVLEAMASGLCVVAYDYAAAKSHIVDGETGALVPFGDSAAFAAAAIRTAGDPELIRKIGARAREYSTSIGWSRVVERFESFLSGSTDDSSANNSTVEPRGLVAVARGRT